MPSNATTAVGLLAGGYLLGRTKKAGLAIGVGVIVVGRRVDLASLRARALPSGALDDPALTELVEALKSAAARALTRRAIGLAESVHGRVVNRGRPEYDEEAEDAEEAAGEDDVEYEYVDEEESGTPVRS